MALTEGAAETAETVWGEIQGQTITFPMVVASANIATVLFTVPSAAAAALVPGNDFEIVESVPGSTQLIIAACDYIENPWGDYREINIGFLAKPVNGGHESAGSFIYRMPVDQAFTCEAGTKVMGFPKTVEQITTEYHDDVVVFDLVFGGRPTLHLSIPRVPADGPPTRVAAASYSYLDGVPYATMLEMDMGSGIVADPSTVGVELGEGLVADELGSLGLPAVPDLASWGEGLGAVFHLGHPVALAG
ncbi:MAG TPA: acetoacetate decarboxylase family protein [Acidimicrobiales bacterium]